ncbi:uncharacterized protein [Primulina eburnea]|uniref:uncharacterized protein n=1 Tax=Primulina eburnea TaxID=1245227 RepID=UPI003C6C5A7F
MLTILGYRFLFWDFSLTILPFFPILSSMADHFGDESSQGSVGRWGDQDNSRRHRDREHRHRRDGSRRFELHRFIQMGPKPLVGGETPDDAEDWIERMESCFRAFQCTEEQKIETLSFLLEGRARKWWRSTSAPIVQSQGRVTWADFRAAFMQLYFPPALRQAKTIELLNLKQGSMSVDEYQQKFFELLPFAPHISGSSEAKYDHFLQGLNQEIFDRVTVCDNPTSYDGLVNRCRQAEISLQRGRAILSSRPPSTLGPRSQSFKKSGSSSSGSGSRSSGVFRFGEKKDACVHCGKNHPSEQCRSAAGACFQCGEMGISRRIVLSCEVEQDLVPDLRRLFSRGGRVRQWVVRIFDLVPKVRFLR